MIFLDRVARPGCSEEATLKRKHELGPEAHQAKIGGERVPGRGHGSAKGLRYTRAWRVGGLKEIGAVDRILRTLVKTQLCFPVCSFSRSIC